MPVTFRLIVAISLVLAMFMGYVWWQDSKDKSEYSQTTGAITYLDKELGELPSRNPGKYRYLVVQGYQYPFEIFVGNESGDFSPAFNEIDKLKPSDVVTVFYYETDNSHDERINRHLKFIDKDNTPYFENGNSKKNLALAVFGILALLVLGSAWLWKTNRIPY